MKSVTIDYKKWATGRLLNHGKYCVLGFVAKEAGVPNKYLQGISRLDSVEHCEGLENLPQFLGKVVTPKIKSRNGRTQYFKENNKKIGIILNYNDSAEYQSNKALRMALLYKLFRKENVTLVFENVPADIMAEFKSYCRSNKKLEAAKKIAKQQYENSYNY